MERTATRNLGPLLWFGGIAAGIYATALVLSPALSALDRSDAIALGLTVDLVLVVPLLYYVLMVRGSGLSVASLAPVVVLSVLAAARILPSGHQQSLRIFEGLAVGLEVGIVGWITWRAARAIRGFRRRGAADPLDQLRHEAVEVLRSDRAAEVVACEIAMFYYAIGAWRARPHAPAGMFAFTHHRRSGHGGIVLALLMLVLVEGLAVHFVVALFSGFAAWALTISSAYAALWLVGDYRATVLRPILVTDETLHIRAGLRWNLLVPRAQITSVERKKPEMGKECLNLPLLAAPKSWVVLSEPVWARGPYGLRRRVRAIGIAADEVDAFREVLGGADVEA